MLVNLGSDKSLIFSSSALNVESSDSTRKDPASSMTEE